MRLKGAALLLVTLGIYRFWLMTDVRRFLWSNTEIAGETLEYNGLATELLLGFLFAVAILIPIYVGIAMATLTLDLPDYASGLGGFALLIVFGAFARYRARRYRLTRTVFRGLRFHQDGSGWLYALYAILWWSLVIVTFGLAYPWAQAGLERYMMRHTSYGKLPGRFAGSGWRLFVRGIPLWLGCLAPLLLVALFLAVKVDWKILGSAHPENALGPDFAGPRGAGKDRRHLRRRLRRQHPDRHPALSGVSGDRLPLVALGPALRRYRRHLAAADRPSLSDLSALHRHFDFVQHRDVDRPQRSRRFLSFALANGLPSSAGNIPGREVISAGIALVLYAAFALGLSAVHQVLITFGIWRAAAESAEISNAPVLDSVEATPGLSSALGEGLVDALGFGSV